MTTVSESQDYFKREKELLKIFGLSIAGNDSIYYKVYSFFILIFVISTYMLLDFWELFKHDFDEIGDIVTYFAGAFSACAKSFVVFRNRKVISNLMDKLGRKPFLPDLERGGKVEEEIMQECLWITATQTKIYLTIGLSSIVGASTYIFIHRFTHSDYRDWEFAYGKFTVLNVTYSPNYEISATYQCCSMFYEAALFMTIDLLAASVLVHISYQFKILQNNLKKLVENSYIDMLKDRSDERFIMFQNNLFDYKIEPSEIPYRYLQKSLIKAVHYHRSIINVVKELEAIFSNLYLLIFIGTLSELGFLIYNASLTTSIPKLVKSFGELVSFSLQVATVCFWGEQVIHESQMASAAAYESNFVGTDLRFQKSVAFIIRMCQYPIKLTAGNFTTICLASFTWIIRTSYSTFMVLRHNNANTIQLGR